MTFKAALYTIGTLPKDAIWVSEEQFDTEEEAQQFAQTHAEEIDQENLLATSIEA